MTNVEFIWSTEKTATGFDAIVGKRPTTPDMETFVSAYEELERKTYKTRAIAKSRAIKLCNHYSATA